MYLATKHGRIPMNLLMNLSSDSSRSVWVIICYVREFPISTRLSLLQMHLDLCRYRPSHLSSNSPHQTASSRTSSTTVSNNMSSTAAVPLSQSLISYHGLASGILDASQGLFPVEGPGYTKISVLLLHWGCEGHPAMELYRLWDLLEKDFGFEVDTFAIPQITGLPQDRIMPQVSLSLSNRITEFVKDDDKRAHGQDVPNVLKLIYYAGHMQLRFNASGLPVPFMCNTLYDNSMYREISWQSVYDRLASASCDLLLLLDCCLPYPNNASSRPVTHNIEIIVSATDQDTARDPNRPSFTKALIHALKVLRQRVVSGQMPFFTAGILYNSILDRFQQWSPKELEAKSSPVHFVMERHGDPCLRSIRLAPWQEEPVPDGPSDAFVDGDSNGDDASQDTSSVDEFLFSTTPKLAWGIRLMGRLPRSFTYSSILLHQFPALKKWVRFVRVNEPLDAPGNRLILAFPAALAAYFPRHLALLFGLGREYGNIIFYDAIDSYLSFKKYRAEEDRLPQGMYVPEVADSEEQLRGLLNSLNNIVDIALEYMSGPPPDLDNLVSPDGGGPPTNSHPSAGQQQLVTGQGLPGMRKASDTMLARMFKELDFEINKIDAKVDLQCPEQVRFACNAHKLFQCLHELVIPRPGLDDETSSVYDRPLAGSWTPVTEADFQPEDTHQAHGLHSLNSWYMIGPETLRHWTN